MEGHLFMANQLFESIFQGSTVSLFSFVVSLVVALILGLLVATVHMVKNEYSKGFVTSIALLPAAVAVVIIMVNGNVGTGVAVAGAFSLVRFRSLPGTAREIISIFIAMAIGLACGMGYIGFALMFSLIIGIFQFIYIISDFGEKDRSGLTRTLKITVPESLNYLDAFDDVLNAYTSEYTLMSIKTTNLGSMVRLVYKVVLVDAKEERNFIDNLRTRNANLEINMARLDYSLESL